MNGRMYRTADVLAKYRDLVGDDVGLIRGLGPATEDDVRTAVVQVHTTVEPWSLATRDRLVQALEGIVRARRPRYRVERVIPTAGRRASLAILHDPDGGLDNYKEAWARFRRRANDEARWTLDREQWRIKTLMDGTVEEAARRRGVSKKTLQNRRAQLRAAGVDPDNLVRRVADDD
jgi:hypothetical protein